MTQPRPAADAVAATTVGPASNRKWLWRLVLSAAVTGAFLTLLFSSELLASLPDALARADVAHLVGLCLGGVLVHLLRAWRLSLCVERGSRGLTRRAFVISTWHGFWISVLPARTGEVSFVLLLSRNYGRGVADAVGLLLLFRILDLLIVCAIGGVSAWIVLASQPEWAQWRALAGLGGIAAGLGVASLLALCLAARAYLPAWQPRNAALRWLRQALTAAVTLTWRRFAAVWLISISMWICMTWAVQQGLLAVEPVVDLATAGLVSASSVLSFALPINGVASVGPFEAAWTAASALAGHDPGVALAGAILAHVLLLALTTAMLLPAVLLRR